MEVKIELPADNLRSKHFYNASLQRGFPQRIQIVLQTHSKCPLRVNLVK